jgi:hypothetical protein
LGVASAPLGLGVNAAPNRLLDLALKVLGVLAVA